MPKGACHFIFLRRQLHAPCRQRRAQRPPCRLATILADTPAVKQPLDHITVARDLAKQFAT